MKAFLSATVHKHNTLALVPLFTNPKLLLFLPGGSETFVIIFAVLLLFGGKKIPELMRGLGRGIREFNDARDSVKKSLDDSIRIAEREAEEQKRQALLKAREEQQEGLAGGH